MNKFIRNLLTEWRKLDLPFENETFVIAVSGGADSVSLTLALHELKKRKKLNLNFIVAHFNHNLRGDESEKDSQFVKVLAEKVSFKLLSSVPQIPIRDQKGNLEENARNARYKFLNEVAEENKVYAILTAHTRNDQAETFLLNLIRGSGLEGLAGIKVSQKQNKEGNKLNEHLLIRPLLNWASREDTENFCFENETAFCLDSMNEDIKYSRVKIRKEIIPLLKKINPRIIETLSNTANLLREDCEFLEITEQKVPEILIQSELKEMSKSRLMRVLRTWLLKHKGSLRQLDLKHFQAVERLINSRKSGRFVELPGGEMILKRDGKLFFEKSAVEKSFTDN